MSSISLFSAGRPRTESASSVRHPHRSLSPAPRPPASPPRHVSPQTPSTAPRTSRWPGPAPSAAPAYLSLVLAALALERVVAQVGDADEPAEVAHVHAVRVADLEQPLAQELRGAVCDLAVALHLSEPETAVPVRGGRRAGAPRSAGVMETGGRGPSGSDSSGWRGTVRTADVSKSA